MHVHEVELFDGPAALFSAVSTTYGLNAMVRSALADQVTIYAESSANQALTLQAVGHRRNASRDLDGLLNIAGGVTLPATTGNITVSVNMQDFWHQYMGATLATGGTAPTTGRVQVTADIRCLDHKCPEEQIDNGMVAPGRRRAA